MVKRLMNILIAKAYRTRSSESLYIFAGTRPIIIKAEEAAKRYEVWKRHRENIQKIFQKLDITNGRNLLT